MGELRQLQDSLHEEEQILHLRTWTQTTASNSTRSGLLHG